MRINHMIVSIVIASNSIFFTYDITEASAVQTKSIGSTKAANGDYLVYVKGIT